MSTEAEFAMLMLRILVDKPKELQKVMDYLQREVAARKAELEAGITGFATREEIMREFFEKYGLIVDFTDNDQEIRPNQLLSDVLSERLQGLPSGARFRLG
jgi:hypothetical protein